MICVAIQERSVTACLTAIDQCEMAEIRIDLCGFDAAQTAQVFKESTKPLVATCRPDNHSDELRMSLLKVAIESGAAYVDVEIESTPSFKAEMAQFARKHSCKYIVSYHNYEYTPGLIALQEIVKQCFADGADIAKIATLSCSAQDSARLLSLYDTNKSLVILGMGQAGKITRFAAPLLGAAFTFAALNEAQATAPGQMTRQTMQDLYKLLV